MTLANCPMHISLPDPLKSKVSLSFTIKKVYETINQLILLFIVQFSLHSLFQLFFPQNTLHLNCTSQPRQIFSPSAMAC